MIKREEYFKKIRPFYDSDLIKVIVGIRRCGKSIILDQIQEEIKTKTDNIIYLNFEDIRTSNLIKNGLDLVNYVEQHKKHGKAYLFFDEIHQLADWQNACKTLRLEHSLFITGSNSKLLSSEYIKELSGRFVSFRIRPFVYQEIMEYAHELNKDITIMDYLIWGGFPKRFEFHSLEETRLYLTEIDNTIVINDIISRYNIRKIELFNKIVNYIMISNSRIFSAKSIADYIKNEKYQCSINTIINYLSYLEQAYVINNITPYDSKAKNELKYYKKLYLEDVSMNSLRVIDGMYDFTHNFENIIYNELIYRGYDVKTFKNNDYEIDFIAFKNGIKYYIQVAYSIIEKNAYIREMKPFEKLDNLNQKIIITNDDVDFSTSTVKHLKFKDFLMNDEL